MTNQWIFVLVFQPHNNITKEKGKPKDKLLII